MNAIIRSKHIFHIITKFITENLKFQGNDVNNSDLNLSEVDEYMPDMQTYANELIAKALLDGKYTMEQAIADIISEWDAMDYQMVKEAVNDKAAELGLIK